MEKSGSARIGAVEKVLSCIMKCNRYEAFAAQGPKEASRAHTAPRTFNSAPLRDAPTRTSLVAATPVERTLAIHVDGRPLIELVCTPNELDYLTLGHLLSEGVIESARNIASLELETNSGDAVAKVSLRSRQCRTKASPYGQSCHAGLYGQSCHAGPPQRQVSLCSTTGQRSFRIPNSGSDRGLRSVQPIPWNIEWVFDLAREFAHDTPTHRATKGSHSCMVAHRGAVLGCCEDIGRHNAFDKALGFAMIHETDLTQCLFFSSGRIPTDMVRKAIRARIPILVSKGMPSDRTVEMARRFDLTLVCCTHADSCLVFNDPSARACKTA